MNDYRKIFGQCGNLDELKKAYRAAAMENHPDRGGSTEIMQDVNAAYEMMFNSLKLRQNETAQADPEGKVKATTETAGEFMDIIDLLLRMEGLEVELCGRWLWIGGETYRHKDALKSAGCRWSNTKKLWSWHHAEDGDHWHRGKRSMRQIRQRYGSTRFEKGQDAEALPA